MEWKYTGKFIDRSPLIRAAGAPLAKCEQTSDCLRVYPVDDAIVTVLTEAGLRKVPAEGRRQRMNNIRHQGVHTDVRPLLNPPVETHYKTLVRDLQETTWDSYWNKQLGNIRDPIGGLPPHVADDPTFTFGQPPRPDVPSGEELCNPRVTPYEIVFNEAEHHEMYKRTHNDYYPAERVNRHYAQPPFDPTSRFGTKPKQLPSVKCSLVAKNWQPAAVANNVLADYLDRQHTRLGKALTPINVIKCVKPGHRFGKKSVREFHSLPELLQPRTDNSNFRKDFRVCVAALNQLRMTYKKKRVDFRQLYARCKYADTSDSEWLHIDAFQRILLDNYLSFPQHEIIPFANCFGIYQNEMVHYGALLGLFNSDVELPDFNKIDANYDASGDFITTYMAARCDYMIKDNSKMPTAGVASFRRDIKHVPVPDNEPRICRENLGTETRADAVVNPSILTNYGLTQLDLLAPREPEFIRTLFERLGYEFPEDTFDKLWCTGQQIDRSCRVSVDTFRMLMDRVAPITMKPEPEDACYRNEPDELCPK